MSRETIQVRQSAALATELIEEFANAARTSVNDAVLADFAAEEALNGRLGVEFLQGFYSGLSYALVWFINHSMAENPDPRPIATLTNMTLEAARMYVTVFERKVGER